MQRNRTARAITLAALLGVTGYLLLRIILPFLSPILWAMVLAVFLAPMQNYLNHKIRSRGLAALVGVLITAAFIITPLIIFAIEVSSEGNQLYHMLRDRHMIEQFQNWYQQNILMRLSGGLQQIFGDSGVRMGENLSAGVESVANNLINRSKQFISGSLLSLVNLFFVHFTLYFLLRDGDKFHRWLLHLLPISNSQQQKLGERIKEVIKSTFYGTLLNAVQNGLMLGLMFYILKLPGALLWTLMMILLAVIPVIGPAIVWLPAVIWLFVAGQTLKGIILLVWCTIIVGGLDKLIRPLLMRNHVTLHSMAAFYGALGGLLVFGLIGLVIGPVLIACFSTLANFVMQMEHEQESSTSSDIITDTSPTLHKQAS